MNLKDYAQKLMMHLSDRELEDFTSQLDEDPSFFLDGCNEVCEKRIPYIFEDLPECSKQEILELQFYAAYSDRENASPELERILATDKTPVREKTFAKFLRLSLIEKVEEGTPLYDIRITDHGRHVLKVLKKLKLTCFRCGKPAKGNVNLFTEEGGLVHICDACDAKDAI